MASEVGDPVDDQPYDEFAAHEPPVHHIGAYLGWLIRGGLVDEERFAADDLQAVRRGEKAGIDLEPAVGGKLSPSFMTLEGRRFSDFYYDRYLTEYDHLAAGEVVPARDAVEGLIDERYGQWVARGRPAGKPREGSAPPPPRAGTGRVAPATASFTGSTWVQIEQQKAELARTMHLAFKDDPIGGTPSGGDPASDDAAEEAAELEPEERKPRWKFWR